MRTRWKAALVAVVSMAGFGYAAGSVLGGPERLPDVGAPVVLGPGSDRPAGDRMGDDDHGGLVYPDPEGEQEAALERRELRLDRRELRQDRREARLERRETPDERREARSQREDRRFRPAADHDAADDDAAGDGGRAGGQDDGGDVGDDDGRDDDGDGDDDD